MKKSVNLIIESKIQSPLVKKLKKYLPILSVIGLIVFLLSFIISLIYINSNLKDYETMKQEVAQLEDKISGMKKTEGIYDITATKIKALEMILADKKSYLKAIENIEYLQQLDISIPSAEISSDGKIAFSVSASTSAQVDDFVALLLDQEKKKIFSNIEAQSFLKDKQGAYNFGVVLTIDSSLLK